MCDKLAITFFKNWPDAVGMDIKRPTLKFDSVVLLLIVILSLGCGSGYVAAGATVSAASSGGTGATGGSSGSSGSGGSGSTTGGSGSTGGTVTNSSPANGTYTWLAPAIGSTASIGTLQIQNGGGTIQLAAPYIMAPGGVRCVSVSASQVVSGQTLTETFAFGSTTVHLTVALTVTNNHLVANIDADKPLVRNLLMGSALPNLGGTPMSAPYYSNTFYYIPGYQLFANAWWDWHSSNATITDGSELDYQVRSDGSRNPLHEQLNVVISPVVADVLPQIGNTPSPYLAELSGRAVFDIWTEPSFGQIQTELVNLGQNGINNCVDIIHVWQDLGYDNGLPGHFPANSGIGGNQALAQTVQAGKNNGCIVGLHQNYMDYYPNYDKFTSKALAIDVNGNTVPTWLNSFGVQAHQVKPSLMQQNAQTQSPTIHSLFSTNASYIDVNSSLDPWVRRDMDASVSGAGSSAAWVANASGLWSYERNVEAGPVFGEGGQHWYYSGMLDGVEAQFGAGSGGHSVTNTGQTTPLFVDFDVLRIHPLQVNHGMGYYERWNSNASTLMTTVQMDQYRMQELAFGHAPYVGSAYWNDVIHALQETKLAGPVAKSYGTALGTSIQYQVNDNWVSSSVAALTGTFSRVQVAYDSGTTVIANSQSTALTIDGVTLPQYGWVAKGSDLTAFTAQCGTSICDYAETSKTLFANARNQYALAAGQGYAAPSVYSFQQKGYRAFTIGYEWDINRALNGPYKPFVHFVNDSQLSNNFGTVFQDDYNFTSDTEGWSAGLVVKSGAIQLELPSSLADGTYSVRVGLWNTSNNTRLPLAGTDDGTKRYIIGHLKVSGGGSSITYTAVPVAAADPRMNSNGHVVTFPSIQTDGAVSIDQENGSWVLRSYPVGRVSTILLNTSKFPAPASVTTSASGGQKTVSAASSGYWQIPQDGSATYSWPVQ